MAYAFKPSQPALPKPRELPALHDSIENAFLKNGYSAEEAKKNTDVCALLGLTYEELTMWPHDKPRELGVRIKTEIEECVAAYRKDGGDTPMAQLLASVDEIPDPELQRIGKQLRNAKQNRVAPFRERIRRNPKLKELIGYLAGAADEGADEFNMRILPGNYLNKARDIDELFAFAKAAYEGTRELPTASKARRRYRETMLTDIITRSNSLQEFIAWNAAAMRVVQEIASEHPEAYPLCIQSSCSLAPSIIKLSNASDDFRKRFDSYKPIIFRPFETKTVNLCDYLEYVAPFVISKVPEPSDAAAMKLLDDTIRRAISICELEYGDASWYLGCIEKTMRASDNLEGFTKSQEVIFRNRIKDTKWIPFISHALQRGKISENELPATLRVLKVISEKNGDASARGSFLFKHNRTNPALSYVEEALIANAGLTLASTERVARAIARERTNEKRLMLTQVVSYALAKPEAREIVSALLLNEPFSRISRATAIIPVLVDLQEGKLLDGRQVLDVAESGNAEDAAAIHLKTQLQRIYSVSPVSKESVRAVDDRNFVFDAVGFHSSYNNIHAAREILTGLVQAYFTSGVSGVKNAKLSATSDPRVTPGIRQALSVADSYRVTRTRTNGDPFERFATPLSEYNAHSSALANRADVINALSERLSQVRAESLSPELGEAIAREDINALLSLQLKGAEARQQGIAIELLRAKRAESALEIGVTISRELSSIANLPSEARAGKILALHSEKSAECTEAFDALGALKSYLDRTGKTDAGEAVANMRAILKELADFNATPEMETVHARVSFDLYYTLQLGRYGASGQGNCQKWSREAGVNQSLASFIGDPTELQIVLTDSSEMMNGFRQLHGCFIDGEFSFILEKNVYTGKGQLAGTMSEASAEDARRIAEGTGFKAFRRDDEHGVTMTVGVPKSRVKRFWDCYGKEIEPEATEISLKLSPL